MGYSKLQFVASQWREQVQDDALVIEGEDRKTECRVVCTPIPGSEPPQVEYSCRPGLSCLKCELKSEKTPEGAVVYWCECVDGGISAASAKSVRSKAKKRK